MEPTKELVDSIYQEKVERARQQSEDCKLTAGPELFDMGVEWMKVGVRMDNPDFDEQQVRREITRRFEIGRRLENKN